MCVRVVLLLVLGFVCFECAVLTGKALFCRDPDSGKLYQVNTTWPSSSFCGNYTCRIRKRNASQTDILFRQININNVKNTNKTFEATEPNNVPNLHKDKNADLDNNIIDVEKNLKNLDSKIVSGVITEMPFIYNNDKEMYTDMKKNNDVKPQTPVPYSQERITSAQSANINTFVDKTSDRHLTEEEIKSITELLHTVKKSDLEAIVDIYNLAQEIYKEMDKTTEENLIDETLNAILDDKMKNKPTSYWYDSIANKGKIDKFDTELQDFNNVHTKADRDLPFYNSAFSNRELANIPMYYPLSNFQRLASYQHMPNYQQVKSTEPAKINTKTFTHQKGSTKEIPHTYLLPYPFAYVNQYNLSDLPSFYYNNPSWRLDYYNRYKYYQPYYNAFIAQVPTPLRTIYTNEEAQDIEQMPINQNELDRLEKLEPEWKTGPIPREEIEKIRANVDTTNFLQFPFRKLVKLEKVGPSNDNVTDSKEEPLRVKRSTNEYKMKEDDIDGNDGDYETYLEKVSCKHHTDPGYFRIGNMSQPYPQCCPQLIQNQTHL